MELVAKPFELNEPCFVNNLPAVFIAYTTEAKNYAVVRMDVSVDDLGECCEDASADHPIIEIDSKRIRRSLVDVGQELEQKMRKLEREHMSELRGKERAMQAEVRALDERRKATVKLLSKYGELQMAIDYLEGAFKFIVRESYGFSVKTIAEDDKERDQHDREPVMYMWRKRAKLNEFEFFTNQYSDGSGSSARAWLFSTREETIEFLTVMVDNRVCAEPKRCCLPSDAVVEFVGGWEMFSQAVRAAKRDHDEIAVKRKLEAVESARASLAKAEKELANVQN